MEAYDISTIQIIPIILGNPGDNQSYIDQIRNSPISIGINRDGIRADSLELRIKIVSNSPKNIVEVRPNIEVAEYSMEDGADLNHLYKLVATKDSAFLVPDFLFPGPEYNEKVGPAGILQFFYVPAPQQPVPLPSQAVPSTSNS